MDFQKSFQNLKTYCEKENYKGWDPYDGLNSKIFQATPLKHWAFSRLAWIQLFKQNPVNLRKLLLVPKGYNPKALGLFLTGYCNLYKLAKQGDEEFGSQDEITVKIKYLADLLLELKTPGYSGACWGYNFDWQARSFFFPKYTPTVVATSFCAIALFNAYETTKNERYRKVALSSANFVIKDLKRTKKQFGFLFSYAPIPGNNTVYNASLLGSKLLSLCYHYEKKVEFADAAKGSVAACINAQQEDGSWIYGERSSQTWIDSFHTGYNLEALQIYMDCTGDNSVTTAIKKGADFYLSHFFEKDGTPKYYHDRTYPIDIHCPAQIVVTLHHLNKISENCELIDKVLNWTVVNMQDKSGYFYYQLKKGCSSKISYMRWSNAFMFYAFSYYYLAKTEI